PVVRFLSLSLSLSLSLTPSLSLSLSPSCRSDIISQLLLQSYACLPVDMVPEMVTKD
ncbi:hypothetical protein LEMLEM_LOCUS21515, partial [Lemmus lemmus]